MRRLVIFFAFLAACASQVDADHQGDVLARLDGSVRNTRAQPLDHGAEVVVVWENTSGTPDLTGTASVEVQGAFPAEFTISLYEPPPDMLINDFGGVKVGVAFVIAGVPGTDYTNDQAAEAGLLGMDIDHLLVYVPAAVPAGSAASIILRSTPEPGYHLYGVHRLTDAEKDTRRACVEGLGENATLEATYSQCGGSASFDDFVPPASANPTLQIDLVDDPETIDVPNWT